MSHQDTGVKRGSNTSVNDINLREIGEAAKYSTRLKKGPVGELEGLYQAAMKIQPALTDKRIRDITRDWKPGENLEEELIREEGGVVGPWRVQCYRFKS